MRCMTVVPGPQAVVLFIDAVLAADLLVDPSDPARSPTVAAMVAAFAEPVSRTRYVHEYRVTSFSLGGGVARGLTPDAVYRLLHGCARDPWESCVVDLAADTAGDDLLHDPVCVFVRGAMSSYGLARIVVTTQACRVECRTEEVARRLRNDPTVASQAAGPVTSSSDSSTLGGAGDAVTVVDSDEEDRQVGGAAPRDAHLLDDGDDGDEPFRYSFPLIDSAAAKYVADRALTLGVPTPQHYDYYTDTSLPEAPLALRTSTRPRPYQRSAVEAAAGTGRCCSGVLVVPCGGGKTLIGVLLLCTVRRPAVILCASAVSVEQWRSQLHDFAAFEGAKTDLRDARGADPNAPAAAVQQRVACLTGRQKDTITAHTSVVITTYSMLAVAHRSWQQLQQQQHRPGAASRSRRANPAHGFFRPEGWGVLLLDEAHVVPAAFFREAIAALKAKATVGLTATFVREDDRIRHLQHLIGPKLFDVSWDELCKDGFLADARCVELHCPMAREFALEYYTRASADVAPRGGLLAALAAANSWKLACCAALLQRHRGAKALVFCDYIELLKEYAAVLRCPVVHGETSHSDRMKLFSDFEQTAALNVLCVSRVGDVSVNLPSASVVIQVSSHGGSRRQEAQRLGRVLRPKARRADGRPAKAYFYALVSDGTVEARYASHRTGFLVDQGYACRLTTFDPATDAFVRDVPPETAAAWAEPQRRVAWLARVVAHWEIGRMALDRDPEAAERKRAREEPPGSGDEAPVKTEPDVGLVQPQEVDAGRVLLGADDIVYHEFT